LSFHKVNNINTEGGGIMALIAHWPLNGNTNDVSGNGLNGSLVNSPTLESGKIGQSYYFNGNSQSIFVTGGRTLYSFKYKFSVSAWVKITNPNDGIRRGFINNWTGSSREWELTKDTSGKLQLRTSTNGLDSGQVLFFSDTVLPSDQWAHVAFTFEAGNQVKFYLNGVTDGVRSAVSVNPLWSVGINGLTIGGIFSSYFIGNINDVRIYDNILTDIEIQEIARAQILHYSFDDFQEPTTNLWSNTNGRATNASPGGTTPPTVELISMTTPFGNQAWKVTIPANANTGYAGCRVTTNSATMFYDGRPYSYFTYVTGNLTGITIYPTGSRGQASTSYNSSKDIAEWKYYVRENVTDSTGGSGGLFMTYFVSSTSSQERIFYISVNQLEQKAYSTEFIAGSRTGKANDYSGFFNHSSDLTETNTPRWLSDAKIGSGNYYFNGSLKVIQKFSQPVPTSEFSISCWFKRDGTQNYLSTFVPIIGWRFSSETLRSVELYNGNTIRYHDYQGNSHIDTTIVALDNTWYHVAATNDNTKIRIYVNGIKITEVNTNLSVNNSSEFSIGGSLYTNSNRVFKGNIDDVRIYSTTLSDKDILDLYNTKAEIEQSGVLYARDFLSNAEATVNIATNSFLESGWTGSSELIDSTTKTFRLSQPFPNNSSAWRTYYYNVSNYIGQTITISAFFRVLSETNGNFLDVTVGQGNTGSFPLHIKGSNEIDKFTSTNRNYHFISWTGVINSTGIVGFTVWIHNLVTGALIISELSKVQVEAKPYATPFVSTFRPATSLPTGVQFGADEIHETGIANFEDFSTVGITDGLIGYWPLNGNLIDYSGGNNTLTASTGVSIVSGKDALAYNFNGTSTAFMTVGVDFTPKKAYTKIAWIRTNTASAANIISGSSGEVFYAFGGLLYLSNTWSSPQISASFNYSDGNWHQVVGTYDGTNGRLYADGQLLVTGPLNDLPNGITTFIGRYSTANNFNGDIQYVKIFNRPLTAEEIKIEYNTMFNNQVQIHESGVVYARDLEQY
jgi:hypothetical protein